MAASDVAGAAALPRGMPAFVVSPKAAIWAASWPAPLAFPLPNVVGAAGITGALMATATGCEPAGTGWLAIRSVGGAVDRALSDTLESDFAVGSPWISVIAAAVLLPAVASTTLFPADASVAPVVTVTSTLRPIVALVPMAAFLAKSPSAVSAISVPLGPLDGDDETSPFPGAGLPGAEFRVPRLTAAN